MSAALGVETTLEIAGPARTSLRRCHAYRRASRAERQPALAPLRLPAGTETSQGVGRRTTNCGSEMGAWAGPHRDSKATIGRPDHFSSNSSAKGIVCTNRAPRDSPRSSYKGGEAQQGGGAARAIPESVGCGLLGKPSTACHLSPAAAQKRARPASLSESRVYQR